MTETTETAAPRDFGWVLLELMGHRQRVGQAREEQVAGGMMLRIDVPTADSDITVTEYYGNSSIYALRPISEDVAKDHYTHTDPRPVRPASYRPQGELADYSEDPDDDYDRPF